MSIKYLIMDMLSSDFAFYTYATLASSVMFNGCIVAHDRIRYGPKCKADKDKVIVASAFATLWPVMVPAFILIGAGMLPYCVHQQFTKKQE